MASGRVEFVDVSVPSEHMLRRGRALAGTHAVGSFAQLLHAAIEVGIALNPSDATATEAAVSVAAAKILEERAALAVTSGVFEIGGPVSTSESLNLDRHWRHGRTHSLEDPVRKYHHLGRFTLFGVSPPRHRQI